MKKSKQRKIAIIILTAVVAIATTVVILGANKKSTSSTESQTGSTSSSQSQQSSSGSSSAGNSSGSTTKTISASEVAQHNSASSCWTIINGKVYDITKEIDVHPGGDQILQACGKDGTVAFNSSGKGGQGHSSSAQQQLASFQIGVAN